MSKAVSLQLGGKRRKLRDAAVPAPIPCFLTHGELHAMTDYDYADREGSMEPTPMPKLTLEDTKQKVKRLQAEGNILAEDGRFRAAMERWTQALEYEPENATLHELIAQGYMATEEYFKGIQAATRATELNPQWCDAFVTLAHCQFNFGEVELAHASLSTALSLTEDAQQRQEIESELIEMSALIQVQKEKLESAQSVHFADADAEQVHTCKTNLSRRSVTWK